MKYQKAAVEVVRFSHGNIFAGSQDYVATTQYWGILECQRVEEWNGEAQYMCRTVRVRNITYPDKPGAPETQEQLTFTCPPYIIQ